MLFGHNSLQIKHRHTGWTYAFRVEDALRGVKSSPLEDGDGGIKVELCECLAQESVNIAPFGLIADVP
jgi:type 2A phosphatase activator TIP41